MAVSRYKNETHWPTNGMALSQYLVSYIKQFDIRIAF